MHLVDDGVEHGCIRREVLLEIICHLLGVSELDRFDLLFSAGVDLLRFSLKGRDDQRIGGFIALAVFQQRLLKFLRSLIAVFGLERTGLQQNIRHFIIRIHGSRQLFTGHTQLVRGAGGSFFVLKRAVVAVIDAVEDHADGINVGRRLDRAQQAEQFRC